MVRPIMCFLRAYYLSCRKTLSYYSCTHWLVWIQLMIGTHHIFMMDPYMDYNIMVDNSTQHMYLGSSQWHDVDVIWQIFKPHETLLRFIKWQKEITSNIIKWTCKPTILQSSSRAFMYFMVKFPVTLWLCFDIILSFESCSPIML